MASEAKVNVGPVKYELSSRVKALYSIAMFLGLLAVVVGLVFDKQRMWQAYLVSFFYFVSLAVGGLFFTAIQHVSKAGWSVNIRRISESFTAFFPYAILGAGLLVIGADHLFHWTDTEHMLADRLLKTKMPYLNMTFFVIRLAVFFLAWWFFAKKIVGNSLKQDQTGDSQLTAKNLTLSVVFLLVFAISYSLFSVDTLMSLLPYWYSTIFGVYCFAGLFQSTIAFMTLMVIWGMEKGLLKGYVSNDHLHDLGKFMKAFTVFWAYIAFSQFMLIWYANIPEETEYFLIRGHGGWWYISLSLLFFKFVVPFVALLPRWAKRSPSQLKAVAYLILVMQYVDIYWMVYPNFADHAGGHHAPVLFSFYEIGLFVGFLGLFLMAVHKFLASNSMIPYRDPRVSESIHHHVTY